MTDAIELAHVRELLHQSNIRAHRLEEVITDLLRLHSPSADFITPQVRQGILESAVKVLGQKSTFRTPIDNKPEGSR